MKSLAYPAALVLLVACDGNSYSSPKDTSATDTGNLITDSGADSGSDTQDSGSDTGTDTGRDTSDTGDTGGGGGGNDPCINSYDPVDVTGGVREYTITMSIGAGTSAQENYGGTPGGLYDVYENMSLPDGSSWTVDTYISCRASGSNTGMYITEWQGTTAGSPPSSAMRYLPAEADMGTVGNWSYSFTAGIDPLGLGLPTEVSFEGTFAEIGFETVELYDGTFFEAYHVRNTFSETADFFGTPFNQTGTIDAWYVKGLGLVKETIVNDADGAVVLDRTLSGYYGGLSPE